jgi:hypothetical protein
MRVVHKLIKFARKSHREQLRSVRDTIRYHVVQPARQTTNTACLNLRIKTNTVLINRGWRFPHARNDRTAYVIGLFGTGRWYVNELLLCNIGERARYFRDTIRIHPGPTSMIYSGHATIKHPSRLLYPPEVTARILETVRARFADLIFVNRHPLDSLLTNWIWWRTHIRDNRVIASVSDIYKDTDELCADLERNFLEFEAFAQGGPDFLAAAPGPRFLSFSEFVEETALQLQSATLALRLEDFAVDPVKEFSKIAGVMSLDLVLSGLSLAPPRAKPYGYLAAKENSPRFKNFINGLSTLTKRRIENIGYYVGA